MDQGFIEKHVTKFQRGKIDRLFTMNSLMTVGSFDGLIEALQSAEVYADK